MDKISVAKYLLLAVVVIGCSKRVNQAEFVKQVVGPSLSDISHSTKAPVEGKEIDIPAGALSSGINIPNPIFYVPTPVQGCEGKVFTQRLIGVRGFLENGKTKFLYKPEALSDRREKTANIADVFYRIILLDDSGTKVKSVHSADLMDSSLSNIAGTYMAGGTFFCDSSKNLYLSTKLMKLTELSSGLGHFVARISDRHLSKFYALEIDTQKNFSTAQLKEKKEISNIIPKGQFVDGDKLYGASFENGALTVFKMGLPQFSLEQMKFYRMHNGSRDNIISMVKGLNGNIFAVGTWFHEMKFNLELIKFNDELDALPDVVTDNQTAGEDQIVDVIASAQSFSMSFDRLTLGEDLLLAVVVPNAQKTLVSIDQNTGELDSGFHKTGVEAVPGSTFMMDRFIGNEVVLLAYSKDDKIGLRLVDSKGKVRKVNGEIDSFLVNENPAVLDVVIKEDRKAFVYYKFGNDSNHPKFGVASFEVNP